MTLHSSLCTTVFAREVSVIYAGVNKTAGDFAAARREKSSGPYACDPENRQEDVQDNVLHSYP